MFNKIGYFVEGQPFQNRKAQAIAYASRKADEYGRAVQVTFAANDEVKVIGVAEPTPPASDEISIEFTTEELAA